MRADARRNLDKIIEAASAVLAERGIGAPVELIARRAGVGVGTLYRRFPDRDALLAAIGESYSHQLVDALHRAVDSVGSPWTALREFVIWCAEPGRGAMAAALATMPAERVVDMEEFAKASQRWIELLEGLVRRAQAEGEMRADVGAGDIVTLLNVFTCHPAELPDAVSAQPTRYLTLMLDGMRAVAATGLPG